MISGELKRTGEPTGDISRDDFRAQREAKKQAKATRKNKSLGKGVEHESAEGKLETSLTGGKAKEQTRPPNVVPDKGKGPSEGATAKPPPKDDQQCKEKETPIQNCTEVKGTTSSIEPAQQITEPSNSGSKTNDVANARETDSSPAIIHSLFKPKKGEETAKAKPFQLHPLFYNIGLKVRNNAIRGANSKCAYCLTPSRNTFTHMMFHWERPLCMECLKIWKPT